MTTSTARDSVLSSEIGKYHLVAELARGGMGNVYLAATHGPGGFSKLLVVKELKPDLCDDETYVAMFLDEARLAARLIHPNIVQTNEVGSDGQRHFMVMEFLDGRSLHRVVKRTAGRFPVGSQLRIIGESLLGLHHAHELREFDGEPLGVVHRDVSPLNVFVTFNGQAKVLDFGIAKASDSSLETKMGVLKGRIAYMAPEQAKGAKVDRRADVYSAGVMLWEAAAGRRLWQHMNEVEILTHLLKDSAPTLRSVKPDAPDDLELICARAMAFNRDDRYATAADLLHDLEAHLARRHDNLTMREIGNFVANSFADERKKMNTIIEEAIGRVRAGPRSGVMPTLQGPVVEAPTGVNLSCDGPTSGTSRLYTPSNLSGPVSGSMSRSAPATTNTLESAMAATASNGSWLNKRTAIFGFGGGALVLGAVLLGTTIHGGKAAPDLVVAPAPAVAPAPSREDGELVDVVVRAMPATAQITIDGASVISNPFHARYPRDSQVHHVAASADGYETKLEDVRFAGDVSIDVSLNRLPNAPLHQLVTTSLPVAPHLVKHVAGTPSAPPTTPVSADPTVVSSAVVHVEPAPTHNAAPLARPEVGPTGGHAPLRPIATNNPYGAQ